MKDLRKDTTNRKKRSLKEELYASIIDKTDTTDIVVGMLLSSSLESVVF